MKYLKDKIFILKNTLDPDLENVLLKFDIKVPHITSDTKFFFYSNLLLTKE